MSPRRPHKPFLTACGRVTGYAPPMPDIAAVMVPLAALTPWPDNPRHNDGAPVDAVVDSIRRFGFGAPVLARRENGEIIAGHTRVKAAAVLGLVEVPVRYMDLSAEEAHALALADNRVSEMATWDDEGLRSVLEELRGAGTKIGGLGWDEAGLADLLSAPPDPESTGPGPNLADRFGVPPFSVLDARQGYWQDRKRAWMAMGIQSELGRGASETGIPGGARLPAATLGSDGKTQRGDGRGRVASGGGAADMIDGRAKGLTWGQSAAMAHPTFNHYREAEKAKQGGQRG